MNTRKLMLQMEHWTPKDTPRIVDGHQSHRPIGLSGRASAIPVKPGGPKQRKRGSKGGKGSRVLEPNPIGKVNEKEWAEYLEANISLSPKMYSNTGKVFGPYR